MLGHEPERVPRTLKAAVDELYRAFAVVPKPHVIDGCPCCIDRKEIGVLLGKPLRSITPNELASYASSAFLTVGDVADYLYFLPRILEVTATEPCWWPDPEVTGRAIRTANPETWTTPQRTALRDYLRSVVGTLLESGVYVPLDDWLCAIAKMGFDVESYLKQVEAYPAAVLVYFETNAETLPGNKLTNAFWELPCGAHDAIVNWFFSPAIARIPFEAYGYVLTRPE